MSRGRTPCGNIWEKPAFESPGWIRALIGELTAIHEAENDPPWSMADAPSEFIDRMVTQIVGIEVVIKDMQGKFKLSQNRTAVDQTGVTEGLSLSSRDSLSSADAMIEMMNRET